MLGDMKAKSPRRKIYVRTGPGSRQAIKRLVAEFAVYDVNQEDLVAATWLWMASLAPDYLRESVRPYIAQAERDGEPDPATGEIFTAAVPPAASIDFQTGIKATGTPPEPRPQKKSGGKPRRSTS